MWTLWTLLCCKVLRRSLKQSCDCSAEAYLPGEGKYSSRVARCEHGEDDDGSPEDRDEERDSHQPHPGLVSQDSHERHDVNCAWRRPGTKAGLREVGLGMDAAKTGFKLPLQVGQQSLV